LIRQISFNLPAKKDSLSRSCNVAGNDHMLLLAFPAETFPSIAPHKADVAHSKDRYIAPDILCLFSWFFS
jgi:hypothetical protein